MVHHKNVERINFWRKWILATIHGLSTIISNENDHGRDQVNQFNRQEQQISIKRSRKCAVSNVYTVDTIRKINLMFRQMLLNFGLDVWQYPPYPLYPPVLIPSDYHLFRCLGILWVVIFPWKWRCKTWLGRFGLFNDDEETYSNFRGFIKKYN